MPERILIVEDEPSLAEAVSYALTQEGFATEVAMEGRAALQSFETAPPDLVILDLMLPGLSGWQLFAAFRKLGVVPVIMLTARAEEADRVAGLEMGADDYVTKPFSMRELIARVRAVLRRSSPSPADEVAETQIEADGVRIDLGRHEVLVDGVPLSFSPKEFDLLAYLVQNRGRVRSRENILAAVWGQDAYLDERTVDVHVRWLRKKIEADAAEPRRLLTVRGVGYKFVET
ncbi:MAG TPA: response regulator transcription factor [Armatimonadota bacterium]|jgi:DNA-binding response OmpR family regulator